MAEQIEFADFEPADQDTVRSLILVGLGEHWGHIDEAVNTDLANIGASYGHGRTIVGRMAGQVVATGTIVPHSATVAELCRMSVAAHHRRCGFGRGMVEELTTTARRWGAAEVILETTSHWRDVVAFYESCGFQITRREDGAFGPETWFRRYL